MKPIEDYAYPYNITSVKTAIATLQVMNVGCERNDSNIGGNLFEPSSVAIVIWLIWFLIFPFPPSRDARVSK